MSTDDTIIELLEIPLRLKLIIILQFQSLLRLLKAKQLKNIKQILLYNNIILILILIIKLQILP